MIAMRSLIDSASPWSCVTKTKVMPSARLQQLQLELHLLAQLPVERAERLVEQQHGRAVHQGAGERDALLLAAGELGGLAVGEAAHPHHVEGVDTRSRISAFGVRRCCSP